jgi:hypothetical protein
MGLGSSNNTILVDKCHNLQNLTLSVQLLQDWVTLGKNGFSLQLNCYPQTSPQSTHSGKPLNWAQYVIAVENNSVQWGIQYFSAVRVPPGTPGFGFSPSPNYVAFASAPSNQLPKDCAIKIALTTDHNGLVTKAAFSTTDPAGNYTFTFPSSALIGIYGFQVDLVGPPSGTHSCKFTSASGFLTYSVSPGTLAVQSTNTCGGSQPGTAETSNVVYYPVLPSSGQTVGQEFGLAVHSPPVPPL